MLTTDSTVLAIVDVQGKLATLMHGRERLYDNLQRIVAGAKALDLPILWAEQNPLHMGRTIEELGNLLAPLEPIRKMSFSCMGCEEFVEALELSRRRRVLLAGIECHVCVYQTVVDLCAAGYEVEVVSDAVSSRTAENRQLGLARACEAGARLTSVEMALFELMRTAEHPAFKAVLKVVK